MKFSISHLFLLLATTIFLTSSGMELASSEDIYEGLFPLTDTELPKTPVQYPYNPTIPAVAAPQANYEQVIISGVDLVPIVLAMQQQTEYQQDSQTKESRHSKRTRTNGLSTQLPYKCDQPEPAKTEFSNPMELSERSHTHTQKHRPFPCPLCEHSALTRGHLVKHLQSSLHGLSKTEILQLPLARKPAIPQVSQTLTSEFGKLVECPIKDCTAKHTNAKDYVNHMMLEHPDKLASPNTKFVAPQPIHAIPTSHASPPQKSVFDCEKCDAKHASASDYVDHMLEFHIVKSKDTKDQIKPSMPPALVKTFAVKPTGAQSTLSANQNSSQVKTSQGDRMPQHKPRYCPVQICQKECNSPQDYADHVSSHYGPTYTSSARHYVSAGEFLFDIYKHPQPQQEPR